MSTKKTTGTTKRATRSKKPAAAKTATVKQDVAKPSPVEEAAQAPAQATVQGSEQVKTAAAQSALPQSEITPPAKASAITPAVKEAQTPVVTEKATPAVKENKTPAVKSARAPAVKSASAPAVKEKAEVVIKESAEMVVKENAEVPAVKEKAAVPAKKEEAQVSKKETTFTPINLGPNPYLPHVATVLEVVEETHNIKTFRVVIDDAEVMRNFTFEAGQVGQLSLFGAGESTFVINSPPSNKEYLQFSVMRTGEVTEALHKLSAGDKVGVRAPLGKPFPREQWKGKDIFFVGGGIGMAPIRTIMLDVLEHKADYGKVSLLYGARSPKDMAFSYELESWQNNPDLDCHLTIDSPCEGWECLVGLIPNILTEINPDPKKTIVVLCGPPIMIKFTVQALEKMNFPDESIITTLEKRMKCGIGICGRCNIGSEYVCVDGPVYSWAQLKQLPPEL